MSYLLNEQIIHDPESRMIAAMMSTLSSVDQLSDILGERILVAGDYNVHRVWEAIEPDKI